MFDRQGNGTIQLCVLENHTGFLEENEWYMGKSESRELGSSCSPRERDDAGLDSCSLDGGEVNTFYWA